MWKMHGLNGLRRQRTIPIDGLPEFEKQTRIKTGTDDVVADSIGTQKIHGNITVNTANHNIYQ